MVEERIFRGSSKKKKKKMGKKERQRLYTLARKAKCISSGDAFPGAIVGVREAFSPSLPPSIESSNITHHVHSYILLFHFVERGKNIHSNFANDRYFINVMVVVLGIWNGKEAFLPKPMIQVSRLTVTYCNSHEIMLFLRSLYPFDGLYLLKET